MKIITYTLKHIAALALVVCAGLACLLLPYTYALITLWALATVAALAAANFIADAIYYHAKLKNIKNK